MRKSITAAVMLLAASGAYASPHVIQGMRVGDNKYKIINISNMKCVQQQGQTLPYEARSAVEALVCTWRSEGKHFIVHNKAVPETLTVKFYKPFNRIGELTAVYPASAGYDKLRAEFPTAPYQERPPGKGQGGEAYWIDGQLLTRLACGKKECSVISGINLDKAWDMTEGERAARKKARPAAQGQ